jgi:hypothetical protein
VDNERHGICSDVVARRRVDELSCGNPQVGDREVAYHLVTSHLRLVAKIAMRYRGYGLPIADIISEETWAHAGREALRAGARLPARDLCDVVDQGFDTGIHPGRGKSGALTDERRQPLYYIVIHARNAK